MVKEQEGRKVVPSMEVRWAHGLAVALLMASKTVSADGPAPPPAPPPEDPATCRAWDIEYTLAANVQLADTMMGAGDGVHKIGPGRLVLRVDSQGETLGSRVRMMFYDMRDGFTVVAKALFWGTTVKNNTHTSATADPTGVIARGTLDGRALRWDTVLFGMRTDGDVTCEGSLCGKFGAPPAGVSEVHTPAHPVTFQPFLFDADRKTFTMAYSVVAKSDFPKQTSLITLAGREAKRSCAER
jgi:hypothetical protein